MVGFECFLEDGHIEIPGTEEETDRAAQATCILVDELAHDIVVRHLNDVGQSRKTMYVSVLVKLRVTGLHTVLGRCQVAAVVPLFEEAVQVCQHTFGQENFLGSSELSIIDVKLLALLYLRHQWGSGEDGQQS